MEKLEWLGYPMVKKFKDILFILAQLTNVTDRRTDRDSTGTLQTLHGGIGCTYA